MFGSPQNHRGPSFFLIVSLAAFTETSNAAALERDMAVGCQGKGQSQPLEPGLPITVWVENWAGVSSGVLARAQHVAVEIFRKAGMEINWQTVSAPASSPHAGVDANLILRVIPSKHAGAPNSFMGFRSHRGPDDVRAIVFIDRVELFAERSSGRSGTAAILGGVMAHELGHLLLGSTHSREGVMRADWDKGDAWAATHGNLHFTPEQATFMRAELGRRDAGRR
jgi:hypothetical protein